MNNDTKKENKQIDYKTNLESDYIQANINAYQFLKLKEYKKSKDYYEESVSISKQLNDEYKYTESLTNLAIVQFFCGKISKSLDNLELALRSVQLIQNSRLYIKILSNLCLANLSICKKECIDYLDILIEFIKKEKDIIVQSQLMKLTLNCFFKLDSLIEYFEISDNYNEKLIISDEKDGKSVLRKIIYYFHKFLRDSDYDSWIKCLSDEKENFKIIQDYNGFIFATFNQYSSLYAKNPDKLREAKNKINSVKKILIGNEDDKSAEKILIEMKDKIEYSMKIYKKIWNLELEIGNIRVDYEEDRSQRIFVKIFLKYSLNYIKTELENSVNQTQIKYLNQMKNQIELTLSLEEKNELDISSIKINNIDPEITDTLKKLFENLLYIKYKFTIIKFFKILMIKTLGWSNRQELKEIKSKAFEKFSERKFKIICEGDLLTKINFTSKGKREHFYKLIPDKESIYIFEKLTSNSPYRIITANEITRVCYGITTENVKKKFKNIISTDLKNPWLFLSIVTPARSTDLYLEESTLNTWFYGLRYYLNDVGMWHKAISVNNFLLTRLKLKMIYYIGVIHKKNTDNPYKSLVTSIAKEKKIQNLSFVKILLLYIKLTNTNID